MDYKVAEIPSSSTEKVKISLKNSFLISKYITFSEESTLDHNIFCKIKKNVAENSIKKPEIYEKPLNFYDTSIKINIIYTIDNFLLKKTMLLTNLSKIIPKTKESASEIYERAKKYAYLNKLPRAIKLLNESYKLNHSPKAFIMKSFLMVRSNYKEAKENKSCCGTKTKNNRKLLYLEINKKLNYMAKSVELLWTLMFMSFKEVLKIGKHIEPWQFYASKILEIDKYYGYLAWAIINLQYPQDSASFKKGILLLKELISKFPESPEPYILLWNVLYKQKYFNEAFDTIAEAFIRAVKDLNQKTSELILHFYIKSLEKLKKYLMVLELLQNKYIEDPSVLKFLYLFGKICIKSNLNQFLATGVGALREVKRNVKHYGKLYFWLGKGFFRLGNIFASEKYLKKALILVKKQKFREIIEKDLKNIQQSINYFIENSTEINDDILEVCLKEHPEVYKSFLFLQAKLLLNERNFDKAIKILQEIKSAESFKFLINSVKNLSFDESNEILLKSLKSFKKKDVPTFVLVSAFKSYAKFLIFHGKKEKALWVLKSLLNFFPGWELESFAEKTSQKRLPINFCRKFVFDCINQRSKNQCHITKMSFTRSQTMHKRVMSLDNYFEYKDSEEGFILTKVNSPKITDNSIADFSVYTNPNLIFSIGRLSAWIPKYKQEAIRALTDFLLMQIKPKKAILAVTLLSSLNSNSSC